MGKNDYDLYKDIRKLGHFLYYLMGEKSGQRRVLFMLDCYGDMTQRELQERLSVKSSTMSEMISKMERDGLIVKQPSLRDKRSIVLSLSAKGKKDAQQHRAIMNAVLEKLFECLDEKEKEQMLIYSERLLTHWKEIDEDGTLVSIERSIKDV